MNHGQSLLFNMPEEDGNEKTASFFESLLAHHTDEDRVKAIPVIDSEYASWTRQAISLQREEVKEHLDVITGDISRHLKRLNTLLKRLKEIGYQDEAVTETITYKDFLEVTLHEKLREEHQIIANISEGEIIALTSNLHPLLRHNLKVVCSEKILEKKKKEITFVGELIANQTATENQIAHREKLLQEVKVIQTKLRIIEEIRRLKRLTRRKLALIEHQTYLNINKKKQPHAPFHPILIGGLITLLKSYWFITFNINVGDEHRWGPSNPFYIDDKNAATAQQVGPYLGMIAAIIGFAHSLYVLNALSKKKSLTDEEKVIFKLTKTKTAVSTTIYLLYFMKTFHQKEVVQVFNAINRHVLPHFIKFTSVMFISMALVFIVAGIMVLRAKQKHLNQLKDNRRALLSKLKENAGLTELDLDDEKASDTFVHDFCAGKKTPYDQALQAWQTKAPDEYATLKHQLMHTHLHVQEKQHEIAKAKTDIALMVISFPLTVAWGLFPPGLGLVILGFITVMVVKLVIDYVQNKKFNQAVNELCQESDEERLVIDEGIEDKPEAIDQGYVDVPAVMNPIGDGGG